MTAAAKTTASPTERMVRAGADLLQSGGIDAVSTRAVAAAAGVQPPAIYRQFGDKDGLLDAIARLVIAAYLNEKRLLAGSSHDPATDLRRMWDLHVELGLNEPDCYVLLFGQARPGRVFSTTTEAVDLLRSVIARLGEQGRLRMSVDRATEYFRSTGTGYILTQIGAPPAERDPELSAILFEDTIAAITTGTRSRSRGSATLPSRAIALREALRDQPSLPLSAAEIELLSEWLNRLADD
jgi:AcrR family transcriptional regulator